MTNRGDFPLDPATEADALEQQTPLLDDTETPTPELASLEADEADLTEQAAPVPIDEDDYDR